MSAIIFWQKQLDRWIKKYHVPATISRPGTSLIGEIRLHVGKYSSQELINNIDQQKRKGIVTATDLATYGEILSGDKITYFGQTVTVENADPRIEVGAIIGWDLMLTGTETL